MTSKYFILATATASVTFRPLDKDRVHVTTRVTDAEKGEYRLRQMIMTTDKARKHYNRLLLDGFSKW